ncbi:MAG: CAP domain-containing protein [Acidobacteriota bacterium]|nr:CAP domain-containing protein [Acidobacteriota bacterium]
MRRLLPTLLLLLACSTALAQPVPGSFEARLLTLANRDRAAHRLPPLAWDDALARAALRHGRLASAYPTLQHQYPAEPALQLRAAAAGAHFATVAENLAAANVSPEAVERSWMASPVHRENLLDPALNAVGIAAVPAHGLLYIVQDFGRDVPVQPGGSVVRQVQQLLLERGIRPAASPQAAAEARANCPLEDTTVGHPTLVLRWEGADVSSLPPVVRDHLSAARTGTAAVAVCTPQRPNPGFTVYRIAILLY